MRKNIVTLLICLAVSPAFSAVHATLGETFDKVLAQAVQQAQSQKPLVALYFNDQNRRKAFSEALILVAQFAPEGKDSFIRLQAGKYPQVRVNLVFDTAASLEKQLKANSLDTKTILRPGLDGLTLLDRQRADGLRVLNVFIITDRVFARAVEQDRGIAQAAVSLAHEIYGHVYPSLEDAMHNDQSEKMQETIAYGQSVSFLKRVIASPLFSKLSTSLQTQFRQALQREQAALLKWSGAR